jgi:hypothetical protein
LIVFDHFLSSSLSFDLERSESTVLLFYARLWFTVITLLRWWRSISISIRIFHDIVDDNSLVCSLNVRNFLSNIMLCLKNDRFSWFYTAIYHNDSDYLICHSSHIFLRRSLLSRVTKIVFNRLKNLLLRNKAKQCEMCHESSLMMIISIDKHISTVSWSWMILFTCDLIFWTIVRF